MGGAGAAHLRVDCERRCFARGRRDSRREGQSLRRDFRGRRVWLRDGVRIYACADGGAARDFAGWRGVHSGAERDDQGCDDGGDDLLYDRRKHTDGRIKKVWWRNRRCEDHDDSGDRGGEGAGEQSCGRSDIHDRRDYGYAGFHTAGRELHDGPDGDDYGCDGGRGDSLHDGWDGADGGIGDVLRSDSGGHFGDPEGDCNRQRG